MRYTGRMSMRMDSGSDMSVDARLQALSLAEKAALLSGTRFMETNPVPRLKIPALVMADGPHGLRKQIGGSDNGV